MPSRRPLRSALFVPGDKARLMSKARAFAADAIILDLEDAVVPAGKVAARATIRQALAAGPFVPQVIIRVNAWSTGLTEADLIEALVPPACAVCLPKVESATDVERLANLLEALEVERGWPQGAVAVLALIETARGVLNSQAIARASPRVWALCLGGEDLARDLGAVRTRDGLELAAARGHLVLAARGEGALAIDTLYPDLRDDAGLEAETRRVRQMGYSGKLLIHPGQIEPVHRAFAPSEEEIAWACRVLEVFEGATIRGEGVIALEGKMIDRPVVERARELLALTGNDC